MTDTVSAAQRLSLHAAFHDLNQSRPFNPAALDHVIDRVAAGEPEPAFPPEESPAQPEPVIEPQPAPFEGERFPPVNEPPAGTPLTADERAANGLQPLESEP